MLPRKALEADGHEYYGRNGRELRSRNIASDVPPAENPGRYIAWIRANSMGAHRHDDPYPSTHSARQTVHTIDRRAGEWITQQQRTQRDQVPRPEAQTCRRAIAECQTVLDCRQTQSLV